MAASTPTRDRIIDAAMTLFGDNGFRGTSVAQIEAAAGLTPGAGGLYHHFRSKEEVLTAGIDRHLDRLSALRDIRRLFTDLGDTRAELTMTARYALTELDSETELLRILATESRTRPALVERAVGALVNSTHAEFAAWLQESKACPPERAAAISAVGLGALLSNRLTRGLLGIAPAGVDDETFVATWVEMITNLIGVSPRRA
jgi:AcrR family transcriptional regulator